MTDGDVRHHRLDSKSEHRGENLILVSHIHLVILNENSSILLDEFLHSYMTRSSQEIELHNTDPEALGKTWIQIEM